MRATWRLFMDNWSLVIADLQQFYGINEHSVTNEPWPWFRTLVYGLISEPSSRMSRQLEALSQTP